MGHRSAGLMLAVVLAAIVAPCLTARGQEAPAEESREPTVVLDTTGSWRLHATLKPPVVLLDDGPSPILLPQRWLNNETPSPGADWTAPDFDDAGWLRGATPRAPRTPYLARLCMRGKFRVTDPEQVAGLSLSIDYRGGVRAYLNGQQVACRHLPAFAAAEQLAEDYPPDPFLNDDGSLLLWDPRNRNPKGELGRRLAMRGRSLNGIDLPTGLLREGVNVLAVEIVRASYNQAVEEQKKTDKNGQTTYDLNWNTCQIDRIQLSAESPAGLAPNAVRPAGLQVWNGDVLAGDFDLDFGDPCEPLRPVRIAGARNGCFSGKAVVGSTEPICDLKAEATELRGERGSVAASAVQVRYALPWGYENLTIPYTFQPEPYPLTAHLLGALATEPLDEFPVASAEGRRQALQTPGQPEPVLGAVVPVWITVKVPSDTAAGTYSGQLRVSAAGAEPVSVPVELTVADWTVPDPLEHRTWVELIQSPDTLAVEYGVDPWSDEHFDLIARSMQYLGGMGSRVQYVPLIAETNLGNAESMVRWIEKGDGTYDYDFSVMDRYLDVAEQHAGRPAIVVFVAWDVYVGSKSKLGQSTSSGEQRALEYLEERGAPLGDGPIVTVLAADGSTRNVEMPGYTDPAGKELWGPLFAQLRERMEKRGLADATMLGLVTDSRPTNEEVAFLSEVAPGVNWVAHSHHGFHEHYGYRLHGDARVSYQTRVWHVAFASGTPEGVYSLYGWAQPELIADYERNKGVMGAPCTYWRHVGEFNITGGQRGMGRLGADFWDVIRDKRGRRSGSVSARYPQSSWRNLDLYTSLLAPGPDGPVATVRYEAVREGVQECEARVCLERALRDDALRAKLGEDLVRRCETALDERLVAMWQGLSTLRLTGAPYQRATSWRGRAAPAGHAWFLGSGWQERTETLFSLAGEVTRALEEGRGDGD